MRKILILLTAISIVAVFPTLASTVQNNCFDCWSSYWYGPYTNPIVCTIDQPDYIGRSCTYICSPASSPPLEPYIVTFCDEPGCRQ